MSISEKRGRKHEEKHKTQEYFIDCQDWFHALKTMVSTYMAIPTQNKVCVEQTSEYAMKSEKHYPTASNTVRGTADVWVHNTSLAPVLEPTASFRYSLSVKTKHPIRFMNGCLFYEDLSHSCSILYFKLLRHKNNISS